MKTIITPEFRVSFPQVFEGKMDEKKNKLKYSVSMMFDKTKIDTIPSYKEQFNALKKAIEDAIAGKWPDLQTRPKEIKTPFRDGDLDRSDNPQYENTIFVNAASFHQPGIVDHNVQPIISSKDFYPGCYARATVNTFTYDNSGNVGASFGLQNIQKIRDGEAFSGKKSAEEEFETVPGNYLD